MTVMALRDESGMKEVRRVADHKHIVRLKSMILEGIHLGSSGIILCEEVGSGD